MPEYDEKALLEACGRLCDRVDWGHADMAKAPFAGAFRGGDKRGAAVGLVRHLRARPHPVWPYTRDFVEQVRSSATDAYRVEASASVAALDFDGSHDNYGRGTCLAILPAEAYYAGATRESFRQLTRVMLQGRDHWGQWGAQTLYRLFLFLEAIWPLCDCDDELYVVTLAWLAEETENTWSFSRGWTEATLGTRNHNWWTFEFCGLWKAGLYFPEFRGFTKFQSLFPSALERDFRILMGQDGYSSEQSMSYHLATVNILSSWCRVAERNGLKLPAQVRDSLQVCHELAAKVVAPDGSAPGFGDSGVPNLLPHIRTAAAVFDLPDLKGIAQALDPGTAWPFSDRLISPGVMLGAGLDLLPSYSELQPSLPASPDAALLHDGLYVMRSDWSRAADYLAMEASPRGDIVTSHGHTALLNMVLYSKGTPVLVDSASGWESDSSDAFWRVGTFAHNVATVDDEPHLPIRSAFRWDQSVTPFVDDWISEPAYTYFSGVHEAYERLPERVSAARRKIFCLRGRYWVLIDRFTAKTEAGHSYTQHFQIALPSELAEDGRLVTAGPDGNLLMLPLGSGIRAALEPCPHPLEKAINPDHLTYTRDCDGSGIMVTLLVPFSGDTVPSVEARPIDIRVRDDDRVLDPWEATAIEIEVNGESHLHVDLHMAWNMPWSAGDCESAQRLFNSGIQS